MDEPELVALAIELGARRVAGWSAREERLARSTARVDPALVAATRERIIAGEDPLGEEFCRLRSPVERRKAGATYTPVELVEFMLDRAEALGDAPECIVDPGTGSARFLVAAARRFPAARLIGVELDPVAAILARANLASSGLAARGEIHCADFCRLVLPPADGTTLFIGNPPYVRHHALPAAAKRRFAQAAARRGLRASQLAGLHVHFLMSVFEQARAGDAGVLVTAAEWLDVNYGQLARGLFAGPLGLINLDLMAAESRPFADALTTAAIASFHVGKHVPHVKLTHAASVSRLKQSRALQVDRHLLAVASRWSPLFRRPPRRSSQLVELGEICRVHRGQVTGANAIWIVDAATTDVPARFLQPSITRARELITAGERLTAPTSLRCVIDLPTDLDDLNEAERSIIMRFLRRVRLRGAADGYIARHRRAWWSVELHPPAPILATYMARRPPAFVLNDAHARHINIAHGLYPRQPLAGRQLLALVRHLRTSVDCSGGRTYAGGLVKFEPREMERLLVPRPDALGLGDHSEMTHAHPPH